jgi:hypothetical protein
MKLPERCIPVTDSVVNGILSMMMTTCSSSGNDLDLHLGGVQFESPPGYRLS